MITPYARPFAATTLALVLVLAGCGDDDDAAAPEPTSSADSATAGDHMHGDVLEVPDGMAIPQISVQVTEDAKSGWNLHVELADFVLAPEHASTEAVNGEGHMHLYIDGVKAARLYSTWFHIPELSPGAHDVRVEVTANDHRAYGVDGMAIAGSAEVLVGDVEAGSAVEADEGADVPAPDQTVEIDYRGGSVTVADDRVGVDLGSVVTLLASSDVAEHLHVHGYDLMADIVADGEGSITFVADVPGVFEIELESSGTFVAELEVR